MFEFNVNRMKKNVTEGVRRNLEERERRSNIMVEVERLRRSRELARLNQSLKSNDLLLMMAMRDNDGSESMLRTIERCNNAYFEKR
jgi:hypothetical protein|nr:MAG TPA: hypothetical protein [Caudoviricetes sp.]